MRATMTLWLVILLSITSFYFVWAQDNCGPLGNNDKNELTPVRDRAFYLNTANPAPCSGNITSWSVCYYGPNTANLLTNVWATFAVYRKIGLGSFEHYERVSKVLHAIRANPFIARFETAGQVDGKIQAGGFNCYSNSLDASTSLLTVQAGDVLGACVFDPEDIMISSLIIIARHQLDIVGQISGESLLGMGTSGCTIDALPTSIAANQLLPYHSRRLHLYADIEPFEEPTTPGTTTDVLSTSEASQITIPTTTPLVYTTTPSSSTAVTTTSPKPGPSTTKDTVTTASISVTAQPSTSAQDQRTGVWRTAGIVLGTFLFTLLLIILVVTVFKVVHKYRKTKSDNEQRIEDNTYSYPNPLTVSDLQAEYNFMEEHTFESRGEAIVITEQNATHEQSEILLFPNVAYTKKALTNTATATDVIYDSIGKGTADDIAPYSVHNLPQRLKIDNDNEYDYA